MLGTLRRGLGAGALTGLIVGGVVGTALVPVLGTVVGVAAGTAAGAALGMFCACVLAFFARLGAGEAALRTVAAATSAAGAALIALLVRGSGPWLLVWVAGCAVIGAVVGPAVANGPRDDRRFRTSGVGAAATLGIGAALGAGAGGTVGAVVGALTDPPAFVVAAIAEGALLGTPCGLLVAGIVVAARAALTRPARP